MIPETKQTKNKFEKFREQKEQQKMKRINTQIKEIEEIRERLDKETPPCGHYPKLTDENNETIALNLRPKVNFKDIAISKKTLRGLLDDKKYKMTPIQRASIPHSLYNRDILGASKTGSGKTIAFAIPVIEKLFLNRWSQADGLGALIILPTRELAIQVFEVFRTIGKYHDFSLGLVIGGNNLAKEQSMMYNMNILVGTPGRILQHVSETPFFDADHLQILVIDEADRILDDGFEKELNEILTYLPKEKQTLLFSATLTKSIKSLAKFNLKCPESISINNMENLMMLAENQNSVDKLSSININVKEGLETQIENKQGIMPKNLHQFYTIVEPENKIDVLYSFLNTHKNMKIIVFLTSCKQVRFFYETFKRLRLGFSFLELHGGQKQNKRTAIFFNFLEKTNTVLFATDIAARGMDFPCVNWVVQADAPEDIQTYIHRVGRTARYKSQGSSLLFLSTSELEYLKIFNSKSIPIKSISVNKDKIVNLQPIIRSILSENPDIHYLAQRAITTYYKSIAYQPNKKIFDNKKIDIGKLSLSFGLMVMPQIVTKDGKLNDNIDKEDEEEEVTKKSKLDKFKEKIKRKKEEKKKALKADEKEEKNDFLRIKRKISSDDEQVDIVNIKKPKDSNILVLDQSLIEQRYKDIKSDLKLNKDQAKLENKQRVKAQHKLQRKAAKSRDYEKHGIGNDDEDEEEDGVMLGSNNDESSVEELVTQKNNKQSKEDIAKKLLTSSKRKLLI